MNRLALLWCTLLVFLPACVPQIVQIPYPAAPSAPLVRALDDHRQRFGSLRALARVETERKGKRRVYESVAIVQRGYDRLRVEAYGPLGETIFSLLWNGKNVLVTPPDGSGVRTFGPDELGRLLGIALAPEDLCAILVGSAPQVSDRGGIDAGCSSDGRCVLDAGEGSDRWRIHLRPQDGSGLEIGSIERYRGNTLLFQARYEENAGSGPYVLPRRIVMQDLRQNSSLIVDYLDAEINIDVGDGFFASPGPQGEGQ